MSASASELGETGLGQVLDIVPNHMSLGKENRFWWDVLENGTSSRYASFFDIDWQPQEERLRDKVLVPILADQYGTVLQAGGIKVVRQGNRFQVECCGADAAGRAARRCRRSWRGRRSMRSRTR